MCKKCKCGKRVLLTLLKVLLALAGIIGVLFTVYIFNLDMKLTAMIEPWLNRHYDKIDRDRHL